MTVEDDRNGKQQRDPEAPPKEISVPRVASSMAAMLLMATVSHGGMVIAGHRLMVNIVGVGQISVMLQICRGL